MEGLDNEVSRRVGIGGLRCLFVGHSQQVKRLAMYWGIEKDWDGLFAIKMPHCSGWSTGGGCPRNVVVNSLALGKAGD